MKVKQHHCVNNTWNSNGASINEKNCQLVLVFGAPELIAGTGVLQHFKEMYPAANIVLASTAGEINNAHLFDQSIVATAIEFEKTSLRSVKTTLAEHSSSFEAGSSLAKQLDQEDLSGILVIADGTLIDGGQLVDGFNANNTHNIPVTGGLAGDAARFEKTLTGLNEEPTQGNIIAIGFYGTNIHIGHGSMGGWDEFGIERTITESNRYVLNKLDEKNALELYKDYLGDFAKDLPGAALLFPLSMKPHNAKKTLVRTVLAINDNDQSMTFAGNMPEGSRVRLMRANFDKLIEASAIAANDALSSMKQSKPDLTLLISCVGRKIVLDNRTEEELYAAEEVVGKESVITGFYSYGGLSPFGKGTPCELHNQTMTVTTFSES